LVKVNFASRQIFCFEASTEVETALAAFIQSLGATSSATGSYQILKRRKFKRAIDEFKDLCEKEVAEILETTNSQI